MAEVKLKSAKTGNVRILPLQTSIVHLKRYKQEYPFEDVSGEDFVFPSKYKRDTHISVSAAGQEFKKLGKKVLGRDIYFYLIRHGKAKQLQKIMPAKIYEKIMDHSIETAEKYNHLDKKDIREAMFEKVFEIKEIDEEHRHKLQIQVDEQQKLLQQLAEDNATLFLSVENLQDKLEASLQTKPIKVKIE